MERGVACGGASQWAEYRGIAHADCCRFWFVAVRVVAGGCGWRGACCALDSAEFGLVFRVTGLCCVVRGGYVLLLVALGGRSTACALPCSGYLRCCCVGWLGPEFFWRVLITAEMR